VQFEVINTLVQGDKAAAEIIMAMGQLDQMPEVDVIIIARGGGSFQDLLPFSDERLVRAAAALTKPLVSAIGHENDQPLLDLVSDLRASTPTDAAKRVVPDVVEERKTINLMRERSWYRVSSYVDAQLQLVASVRSRPVLASPYGFVDAQAEQLAVLKRRTGEIFDYRIQVALSEIRELRAKASALSPKLTLERGYSLLFDETGKPAKKLAKGAKFSIVTADQEISATATTVRERDV
jgi:exodeoxyribonuclease VII large subunit